MLLSLAGFTRYSATVWETFPSIVEASARKAPTSARAQAQYATDLFNAQRYDESMQVIDKAIENIPGDHPVLQVNRLIIQCQLGVLSKSDFDRVAGLLSVAYYDVRAIRLYTALTDSVVMGKCPEVSVADLREMYENMLLVAVNSDPRSLGYSHLQYFVGFASVYSGDSRQAVAAFKESLRSRPGASHAMIMAAHLATGGYYDEALAFSELALSQLEVRQQGILSGAPVGKDDVLSFQAVVRSDIKALKTSEQLAPIEDSESSSLDD
jgi:tetratricopeptide (TPR) repeat protein